MVTNSYVSYIIILYKFYFLGDFGEPDYSS